MLAEIWRYPVKTCGGETIEKVEVGPAGLARDRSWAVVDGETGLVASAKRPSLWAPLLSLHVTEIDGELNIGFPSGERHSVDDSESLASLLSAYIGRSVVLRRAGDINAPTLERTDPDVDALLDGGSLEVGDVTTGKLAASAPAGTVFDFAPIHVITTATLHALAGGGEATAGEVRRYRANLVLDVDGPPFQENDWPGKSIAIGSDLILDVVWQTPRCVIPSLAQADLPRSVATLRTLASLNRIELEGRGLASCAGAYATVRRAGAAAVGAAVVVAERVE